MDKISLDLRKHYEKIFKKFGANAKGVDWKNKSQAQLRYRVMLNVIKEEDLKSTKEISVLDVGCGYGAQYLFAKKIGINLAYTGIDIVPDMIKYSQRKIKDATFICDDIFKYNSKHPFDYVICNGILTQKLKASKGQMWNFAQKLIARMFELATKGIVFNTMTTEVDFKRVGNFYVDPAKMLTEALKHTRRVKIDHSYPLYEYSVYMYK